MYYYYYLLIDWFSLCILSIKSTSHNNNIEEIKTGKYCINYVYAFTKYMYLQFAHVIYYIYQTNYNCTIKCNYISFFFLLSSSYHFSIHFYLSYTECIEIIYQLFVGRTKKKKSVDVTFCSLSFAVSIINLISKKKNEEEKKWQKTNKTAWHECSSNAEREYAYEIYTTTTEKN